MTFPRFTAQTSLFTSKSYYCIFDPSFGLAYTTICCTLGYFCGEDFKIVVEVRHKEVYTNLKNQSIVINVNKADLF